MRCLPLCGEGEAEGGKFDTRHRLEPAITIIVLFFSQSTCHWLGHVSTIYKIRAWCRGKE